MPIKPENRDRYPADWKQVRERILKRASYRCEWPGCKAEHRAQGYWRDDVWMPMPSSLLEAGYKPGDIAPCSDDGSMLKIIRIVLTIAHLDHQPEHCDDANLRAWCQRHHLAYDAEHHRISAYMTRHAKANTQSLFDE